MAAWSWSAWHIGHALPTKSRTRELQHRSLAFTKLQGVGGARERCELEHFRLPEENNFLANCSSVKATSKQHTVCVSGGSEFRTTDRASLSPSPQSQGVLAAALVLAFGLSPSYV